MRNVVQGLGGVLLAAIVRCSDGGKGPPAVPDQHRPNNAQCTEPAPPGNISCSIACPTGSNFERASDSDCAATGQNGRCVNGGGPAGSYCTHDSCTADTDCPSAETCACHGSPYTYRAGNASRSRQLPRRRRLWAWADIARHRQRRRAATLATSALVTTVIRRRTSAATTATARANPCRPASTPPPLATGPARAWAATSDGGSARDSPGVHAPG